MLRRWRKATRRGLSEVYPIGSAASHVGWRGCRRTPPLRSVSRHNAGLHSQLRLPR
jgi:hypothetical protein